MTSAVCAVRWRLTWCAGCLLWSRDPCWTRGTRCLISCFWCCAAAVRRLVRPSLQPASVNLIKFYDYLYVVSCILNESTIFDHFGAIYSARQHIAHMISALLGYHPSVRLSVSHTGQNSKKVGLCNFHYSLVFAGKFHPEILTPPERGRQIRERWKETSIYSSFKRQLSETVGDTSKITINVMWCKIKIFGNAPELKKIKSEVRGSR